MMREMEKITRHHQRLSRPLTTVCSLLLLSIGLPAGLQAQEDGFAAPQLHSATPSVPAPVPEAPAPPPSPAVTDDSLQSAGVINDMEALDNSYTLGVGDMITFRVVEDRQPVMRLRIQDSGDVQVPYINAVRAAGSTPRQLAERVKAALEQNLFRQATVIVTLDMRAAQIDPRLRPPEEQMELEEFHIYGKGVVRKGRFQLPPNGELRVSEAVMQAGPTQFANLRRVRLERDGREFRIDVNRVLNRGDLDADAVVQPGDKLLVDERMFNF